MELGAAASVTAVIEVAVEVVALCSQYLVAVKNAKEDIERLRQQIEALKTIGEGAQRLLQGPGGARLETSQDLRNALGTTYSQLDPIRRKLEEQSNKGRGGHKTRRRGLRALTWPFETKDVDKIIANLQRDQDMISAALPIHRTTQILRKIDLLNLPVAKGAAFDDPANEHDPSCHPGTRVDLLAIIHRWIEDPDENCIFWLYGMAGTGKSTISRSVLKWLSETKVPHASFFFKMGERDCGTAAWFFTTVLAQLLPQLPALAPYVQEAIECHPDIVDKTMKVQFEKLFLEPLEMCKGAIPGLLAVVVDALDECDREDATALICLLSRAKEVTSIRLRFFVTSRPEPSIRRGFNNIAGSYQTLALHEIPKADVKKDISTFLRSELTQIRDQFNITVTGPGLPPDWPPSASLETLVDMAAPLFIFASTACRFIGDSAYGDPDEQLEKILKYGKSHTFQLGTTYQFILDHLLLERTKDDKAAIITWFRDIVGTIVLLAEPLTASSLARLLGRSEADVNSKLRGLHSVLDIRDNPVAPIQPFHQSFRNFLVDHENRDVNPFWVDERKTHERLADRCLQLLSTGGTLKKDVCDLRRPGTLRCDIDWQTINSALPPEVQYACRYWVYHWGESQRFIRDNDLVDRFLTDHLLHWLEVLGVMGWIWESINMVDNLLNLLQPEFSTAVSALLRDVRRVILNHCSVIDVSPLQVYCSAIIFAPQESVVRKMFCGQVPDWLSLVSQMDRNWDACLQTLEGHSDAVTSVAFVLDSKTLASASDDRTVKLWDTATGNCRATFEGHSSRVGSVAFAFDGRILASASDDRTVRLWDTAAGNCRTTLKGHNDSVNFVAFAHDGETLASASGDGTIKLWHMATGNCQATLKGHSGWINMVAFSHDSKTLASASWDRTVKFWDTATGNCRATLEGHSDNIRSVAFAYDGKMLASGSDDRTIRLWETATDICRTTFEGHSDSVYSVAFAHDGKTIASASHDGTVKLWDTATSNCRTTFKGHNSWVWSVAFAHDSKTLASASSDGTVRLWNTATGNYRATLKGHSSWVRSIAFTHDGKMLASASNDGTIKLWDTATGDGQATLNKWVKSVVFAHDGKTLASAFHDGTVKLWDTATGNCTMTLEIGIAITSLTFDATNSSLITNIGTFSLNRPLTSPSSQKMVRAPPERPAVPGSSLPLPVDREGIGLSDDRIWVTWGLYKLLWLPPAYRPGQWAVMASTLAIGNSSGRVVLITVSPDSELLI